MTEIQDLKLMITDLGECVKTLTSMTRNLYENQTRMQSVLNNLTPRISEQEKQSELLSRKFHEFIINAPLKEDIKEIKNLIAFSKIPDDTPQQVTHVYQDPHQIGRPLPCQDMTYSTTDATDDNVEPSSDGNHDSHNEETIFLWEPWGYYGDGLAYPTNEATHDNNQDEGHPSDGDVFSENVELSSDGNHDSHNEETIFTPRDRRDIDSLLTFKTRQEDDLCRRTIIFSNLSMLKPEIWNKDGEENNFWPNLRGRLRSIGLDYILHNSQHVKLYKSGSLRITYYKAYEARYMLNWLKNQVTEFNNLPRNRDGSVGDGEIPDFALDAHYKLKFSMATPQRFLRKRKTLEKLAKKLKKEGRIVYFDYIIRGGQIYLKTQWKKNKFIQTSEGLKTYSEKQFTFYSTKIAQQILDGSLGIDEREEVNRQNIMIREQ